ncbi:ANKYRIN REPEAT PLANT PROTEIN [Salix purpurea]|uniref:ANKYRIN REPEAT PLANT PROTEIN n=1 Tax=Salix purpurea TaxID=77065 RepID=A0A9Q0T292_SALPP|nr:ANKYRIN REPEAT PLANT PROTEIN [Salix purpurea]
METPARQQVSRQKKMTKQLTGKRDDTPFHAAARAGDLKLVKEMIAENLGEPAELTAMLSKQNQSGETALYVASECSHVDVVKEMIKYYDTGMASLKARNGCDAFHIAAKQGDLEIVEALMEVDPELSLTFDSSNTTALHSAASQGHVEVIDKKGQTALHMAAKGQAVELVEELIMSDPSLMNMVDNKGSSALHIAVRKGRDQIVRKLLEQKGIDKTIVNRSRETPFDTAEKNGKKGIASILEENGVLSAKSMKPTPKTANRELKQTVSDIRHGVHNQIETTRLTRKRVQGIAKRLNKMQGEGLNNAINSTTVVAVLIATVAFAAIFQLPGQFADHPENLAPGQSAGEAKIAPRPEFMIFIIFDSIALFISLAVVVVQTSIVVIERKAKKQLMSVINKLMWLACVLISIAFLALSYVVVGDDQRWLALAVTVIGTIIMVTTIGTMGYCVIVQRIESSKLRRSLTSRSRSESMSFMEEPEILENDFKKLYAI